MHVTARHALDAPTIRQARPLVCSAPTRYAMDASYYHSRPPWPQSRTARWRRARHPWPSWPRCRCRHGRRVACAMPPCTNRGTVPASPGRKAWLPSRRRHATDSHQGPGHRPHLRGHRHAAQQTPPASFSDNASNAWKAPIFPAFPDYWGMKPSSHLAQRGPFPTFGSLLPSCCLGPPAEREQAHLIPIFFSFFSVFSEVLATSKNS